MPAGQYSPVINLAEVQLYNAAGARIPTSSLVATLSTTHSGAALYSADKCIDGSTTTGFCHTAGVENATLTITYPCSGGLSKVNVVNRADCCWDRITNFQLRFWDEKRQQVGKAYPFQSAVAQYSVQAPGESKHNRAWSCAAYVVPF